MIDIASKIGSCSCWFENYTQKVSLSEEYAKSVLKPTCVYVGVSFDCTLDPPTCELQLNPRKRRGASKQGSSVIMRFILVLAVLAATQVRKL